MTTPPRPAADGAPVGPFWRELASRSRSNLYFALAALPRPRRDAFRTVYRFLRTADDAVDDERLPAAAARRRLDAWRRTLDAAYGAPTPPGRLDVGADDLPRLRQAIARYGLPRAGFDAILDALAEDAGPTRFPTFADLERWCLGLAGGLAELTLAILEAPTRAAQAYGRDVAVALQLANILRDVAEDAARGRLYVPLEDLAAAGCRPAEVLAGRPGPGWAAAARTLSGRARRLVARGRAALEADPTDRGRLLLPQIWADVYLALLDLLEARRYDVFARPVGLSRPRKVGVALARGLRELGHGLRFRALSGRATSRGS